jgi:hypothetical protein
MTCSQIVAESLNTTQQSLNNSKIGSLSFWGAPAGSVVAANWDGLTLNFIKIKEATNGANSCLFCFSGLMQAVNVSVESAFALEGVCS